jgi:squalene-hopene/tetraprenyl-beta-curcumene cyclase
MPDKGQPVASSLMEGATSSVIASDPRERSNLVLSALQEAIARVTAFLMEQRKLDGHWCGELEADTTLESDTVKMWHLLGRVDHVREAKLIATILRHQNADGGWPIYAGGPSELNATVKAYLALRLAGFSNSDARLVRAKETVLRLGGLERINSFEKTYLALLGLYPWGQVPALPPEIIFLPNWFAFNIYEVAYWSRTILVPLTVLYAKRPKWVALDFTVDELWQDPRRKQAKMTNFQKGGAGWRLFFRFANKVLQLHESLPWKPFRKAALRTADRWMTDRLMETDGLGAIYPAMINAVFALKALGYGDGDPALEQSIREVERLELPDGPDGLKLQPCFSPVWDTALALYIVGKSPQRDEAALEQTADWLRQREIRMYGDWRVKNPKAQPGGWAFEYRNPFYPDVDDCAQVLLGFQSLYGKAQAAALPVHQRSVEWILSMQNDNGGWASFDKNNNREQLNHFPFADHNAMLDPSSCDITGRILEMLSGAGLTIKHPQVRRAVDFLLERQEEDGTWFGRWGVNYIYGTWLALRGLKAIGVDLKEARFQKAGQWILSHQNADGGWGESCRSYDDPSLKGQGPSTASQTAWALMALISLGLAQTLEFRKGTDFLVRTQRIDGNWDEAWFTGTGFPRVFYLKYHLYRSYFPLLALTEAEKVLKE